MKSHHIIEIKGSMLGLRTRMHDDIIVSTSRLKVIDTIVVFLIQQHSEFVRSTIIIHSYHLREDITRKNCVVTSESH